MKSDDTFEKVSIEQTLNEILFKMEVIVVLNEDQRYAVDLVSEGHNIFLTGAAGTGKSLTIGTIVSDAQAAGRTVYVTASTGVAASLLSSSVDTGVRTLHSWGGIGLGAYTPHAHASFISKNAGISKRIKETDLLIIDEVSMCDPKYIAKLDSVVRLVRGSTMPFGGIQVVMSGDFSQLPPVSKGTPYYLFEDDVWGALISETVILSKVYRQTKQVFVDVLTKIRSNDVDDEVVRVIQATAKNKLANVQGIKPTVLFCCNKDVDKINSAELDKLAGDPYVHAAVDSYSCPGAAKEHSSNFNLAQTLSLKVGAQVMLLVNIDPDAGLVNGARGVVVGVSPTETPPTVSVVFASGLVRVFGVSAQEIKDERGNVVASRRQFPLRLAWSTTIHKSQGTTIDLLVVDLNGCFAPGQAYVAISRGTSLETMRVLNFSRRAVISSKKVDKFNRIAARKYKVRVEEEVVEPTLKKLKSC